MLAGATHETNLSKVANLSEVAKRVLTMENMIEKHRKRLKWVEEIQGNTPIV
jgi:hypothetical protein